MSQQSLFDIRAKEKSLGEGISRLSCQRAHVDLCSRLFLEREYARRETEGELTLALKEADKYKEYFQTLFSTVKLLLQPSNIVLNLFGSQLTKISDIKARYVAETPKAISFWLFIEDDNWKAEENIYEVYGELLDLFPDMEIDLRLLKLYGRNPEELLPEGFKPW